MAKKRSGYFGARGARGRITREKGGLRATAQAKIYNGIDIGKLNKKYAPKWENVLSTYDDIKKMIKDSVDMLSTEGGGARWDASAKLASPEMRETVGYRIYQFERDARMWDEITDDVFAGAIGKTGNLELEDYDWFVTVGPKITNIINGWQNSMIPIFNEIETCISVMNYEILGVTPAEFEVLPDKTKQELVVAKYGARVAEYNLANPDNPIDPKVVMLSSAVDQALLLDAAGVN